MQAMSRFLGQTNVAISRKSVRQKKCQVEKVSGRTSVKSTKCFLERFNSFSPFVLLLNFVSYGILQPCPCSYLCPKQSSPVLQNLISCNLKLSTVSQSVSFFPGPNVIKPFQLYNLRMFAISLRVWSFKSFQPSITFAGKARSLP